MGVSWWYKLQRLSRAWLNAVIGKVGPVLRVKLNPVQDVIEATWNDLMDAVDMLLAALP
jgi:uncharacterized protein YqgV (UPF0045/DUF77 family)